MGAFLPPVVFCSVCNSLYAFWVPTRCTFEICLAPLRTSLPEKIQTVRERTQEPLIMLPRVRLRQTAESETPTPRCPPLLRVDRLAGLLLATCGETARAGGSLSEGSLLLVLTLHSFSNQVRAAVPP